jgi:hypothetical protein
MNTVMILRVPQNAGKFVSSGTTGALLSRRVQLLGINLLLLKLHTVT